MWPDARVEIIGSYKTELCLPTSDIDLVIFGAYKQMSDLVPLFQLAMLLEEHKLAWRNGVKVITTAKVPIIKFQEVKSGSFIDIAFEVNTGIENTKIVQNFLVQYPLLRPLTLVVKYYLKQNFLNDTWSGGIGSYTLVILIISYLQNHTKSGGESDEENLADLLIGFFDFYGTKFNYTENGISVKDKGYYNKKSKLWFNERVPYSLSVEDPHNPEIDVGLASFEILKAKRAFKDAFYRITEAIKYPSKSYLAQSDIVRAPFVSIFRNHIKKTYSYDYFKKRYPYTKPLPKDKSKYPRKQPYKISRGPNPGENQPYYRPIIPNDPSQPPTTSTQPVNTSQANTSTSHTESVQADKSTNTTKQPAPYSFRKYGNSTRCWNKPLDFRGRIIRESLSDLSVNN